MENEKIIKELWKQLPLFDDTVSSAPVNIYILASNYQIAKSVFDHYFLYTGLSKSNNFRYINDPDSLRGIGDVYVVISDEKYPHSSFYDRLHFLIDFGKIYGIEIIYERYLENEQIRKEVSRQGPKAPKG